MNDEICWHIGKDEPPLDKPPHRAYFYWKKNGQILRSESYSESELQNEIRRRQDFGETISDFVEALQALQNKNH